MAEIKFNPLVRVIEEYLSQIDSILRNNLTKIFSNFSEYGVEIYFHQWPSFLCQNISIVSLSEHSFLYKCIPSIIIEKQLLHIQNI